MSAPTLDSRWIPEGPGNGLLGATGGVIIGAGALIRVGIPLVGCPSGTGGSASVWGVGGTAKFRSSRPVVMLVGPANGTLRRQDLTGLPVSLCGNASDVGRLGLSIGSPGRSPW